MACQLARNATIRGHIQYTQGLVADSWLPSLALRDDLETPIVIPEKSFSVRRETFKAWCTKPKVSPALNTFTDGSKDKNGPTGAGITMYNERGKQLLQTHYSLGNYSTVFQAEL